MTTFGSMSGRSTNKFNKIISFLTQKIIDSETSQREVFDSGEDNLPENIDMFDIEMERDLGTKSTLKQKANIFRMVEGATWTKSLRLWIKFQNAGHLYDYSRNGNFSEVYGLGQIPILMNKKVSDNVIGWEFHSFFNGFDQFAYTEDNTHIRVSEMFADSAVTHISFLDSFNPISIQKASAFETSVLFSKVDDDQIKDGFAATLDQRGNIYFYIKRDWKQYSLFLQGIYAAQLADEIANQGNFNAEDFNPLDFNTDQGYTSDLICSITKSDDHWFVYDKATHVIKYMKNGVTVFDSTQNWVANDPVLDVPFQDGAYNADGSDRTQIHDVSGNNYHGILSNPENGQWQTNNTFFNFGSNTAGSGGGCKTTFPTIAALDSANDFTISFMYKPDSIINTNTWFEYLIRKNWQTDGSFIMYRSPSSGNITAEYRDPTGIKRSVTASGAITTTDWHNVILKCERNQPMKIIIDGVTYTGASALPATALTSTGVLEIGSVTTGLRGTICYFRVFDSALGTTDIQRLVDEGYHNPVFPKSEKPQPEPDPTPPPVLIPFEVFYNLANNLTEANTVWLNSIAGAAPFFEIYNVADGSDVSDPEVNIYDVNDGDTGGSSDPFVEQYRFDNPGGNSSVQLHTGDNDAGGVEVQSGHGLIGLKPTKVHFLLKKENSPSGSVYCRIWDANDNLIVTLQRWNGSSLETLNASSLTTSYAWYEFRNTTYNWGSTSIQAGWKIGIEFSSNNSTNKVHVQRDTTNPKANIVQAARNHGSSSFNSNSSNDVAIIVYTGGGTTATDPFIYMEYVQKIGGGSSNTYLYDRICQRYGTGDPCIGQIPTKIVVKLKKVGSPTGTLRCYLRSAYNSTTNLTEFGTGVNISSIPTTTTQYTFTNLNNTTAIANNYVIMLIWTSSNQSGKIGVMTNTGVTDPHPPAPASNTISYVQKYGYVPGFESIANEVLNYTAIDVSGQFYKGGNDFDADIKFTSSLTRVYEKASTVSSSLEGEPLTKATVKLRKVGSPTGLITCCVRKGDGTDAVRFTVGTYDVSLLTTSYQPITFTNIFNTTLVQLNDRVSFEYLGSDASNYIEILTNKDVFETTNTISGTYSSPVYSDNAQRDISGIFYKGGEPDLNSRIRVAQKINTNDSIIDGEKLTKLLVWLRNPNGATGNIHCIIYRGSDDAPIITIDTIPASGVGTGWASYEFENTNNGYVADVDDKVAIVFEGGSSTQRLGVNVRKNTNYDGANSHIVRYNGNEYDDLEEGTWDLVGTMWRGGYMYQPPANAIPDPTPTNNKNLLYCAGNNLLAGFARVLQREFRIYAEDTTEEEATNVYTNRYSKTTRTAHEVLVAGIYKPF